jgi:hypothetical protein
MPAHSTYSASQRERSSGWVWVIAVVSWFRVGVV